jgi:aldehyde dehydrogenase (NAD+)
VANFVSGDIAAGEALVAHPGVDKINFTGSTEAGRRIGEVCGRSLTPVTLELGGKSAAVVLDDADAEVFAANLIKTTLRNTGQTCKASTRLILPRSRSQEFRDVVRRVLDSSPIGDPRDPGTVFGPLVTARQRERVESYLALAREEDASFLYGGGRPAGLDRGYYVEPTVLADVSPESRLAREEIFGPVLVVFEHDGDDDALRQANDSVFGLAGAVFGADIDRALDVATRIETGTVGVNHYGSNMTAPFSGHKASGLGTDFGPEGLGQYRVLTSIHLRGRAA